MTWESGKFKIRVGVVLVRDGQLLLLRQNGKPFWVFPGGTLEAGETLAACAARELLEEVALTVKVERLLYVADFITAKRQSLDVFFLARYVSGEPVMTLEENLDDMGFFPPEALATMDIRPKPVIDGLLTNWTTGFDALETRYLGAYGTP